MNPKLKLPIERMPNRSHFCLETFSYSFAAAAAATVAVTALCIQQMLLFLFFCAAKFLICECKQ